MSTSPSLTSIPHTILSTALYYSSLSRLTQGAYTPSYYAFQCARHTGDDIPIGSCDAIFATLLCFKKTRLWTAAIVTCFFVVPIVEGLTTKGGRGVLADSAYFLLGVGVLGVEVWERRRRQ